MIRPFSLLALRPYGSLDSRCEIPVPRSEEMFVLVDQIEARVLAKFRTGPVLQALFAFNPSLPAIGCPPRAPIHNHTAGLHEADAIARLNFGFTGRRGHANYFFWLPFSSFT